jgi:hypothetical protein
MNFKNDDGYFIHLLLEVSYSYGWNEEDNTIVPAFCKFGTKKLGYHCIENDCI